jgi:hypothetical protein
MPSYRPRNIGITTKSLNTGHALDNASAVLDDNSSVGISTYITPTSILIGTSWENNFSTSSIASTCSPFVDELESMSKWDFYDNNTFMKYIDEKLGPMRENNSNMLDLFDEDLLHDDLLHEDLLHDDIIHQDLLHEDLQHKDFF